MSDANEAKMKALSLNKSIEPTTGKEEGAILNNILSRLKKLRKFDLRGILLLLLFNSK